MTFAAIKSLFLTENLGVNGDFGLKVDSCLLYPANSEVLLGIFLVKSEFSFFISILFLIN